MARQNLGTHFFPFTAAADYSTGSGQFLFVALGPGPGNDGQPQVSLASVAGQTVIGILQDRPRANQNASVLLLNAPAVAKVHIGAAVSIGTALMTDASGRAVPATAGGYVVGFACQASTHVGDLVEIIPCPGATGSLKARTHIVKSASFTIANGAGVQIDSVLMRNAEPCLLLSARVVYDVVTTGTVAAATVQLGTTIGGADVAAATPLTNAAAVGAVTPLVLLATALAANAPLIARHTGIAAGAGTYYVEVEFLVND